MLNQALSYFLTQYLLPAFAFTFGSQITLGEEITGYYSDPLCHLMNVTEIKVPTKFKDITNNFSIVFLGHAYCMVPEYGGLQ